MKELLSLEEARENAAPLPAEPSRALTAAAMPILYRNDPGSSFGAVERGATAGASGNFGG